ncbi:hypothetical protein KCP75_16570 [Salmonella enterica subsp. enterica]|nr:hypothetical protein KCP75_16570 [Salmonella enterica subsp. enterica]
MRIEALGATPAGFRWRDSGWRYGGESNCRRYGESGSFDLLPCCRKERAGNPLWYCALGDEVRRCSQQNLHIGGLADVVSALRLPAVSRRAVR